MLICIQRDICNKDIRYIYTIYYVSTNLHCNNLLVLVTKYVFYYYYMYI